MRKTNERIETYLMNTLSARKPFLVITVLAMIATMLFAATSSEATAASPPSGACPASTPNAEFSDIGQFDQETQDSINCIAFYDITAGTQPGTFEPNSDTNRWQMALFLTRKLTLAGITLPSGADQGFTDIGTLPAATQTAINQVAQLEISKGATATTYQPYQNVTRWQMALFLSRDLDVMGVLPGTRSFSIEVLSSPAHLVSGDAARIIISVPPGQIENIGVSVNGEDHSDRFIATSTTELEGVVDGLIVGENDVKAHTKITPDQLLGPVKATETLTNHPVTGPMFSGPHQTPFFCATTNHYGDAGLAGPTDDNCSMETVVSFLYRTTGGAWAAYDPAGTPPEDMATTVTMDGSEVDYIVRWERGTINRFIYSIAVLSPNSQNVDSPDLTVWNDRLIYAFQGGVAIGHYQGDPAESQMLYEFGLSMGYAVIYSTGTSTATHYNLELGGETAIMVKDRFVTAYGNPFYTVGVGGSGGGIQQYIYAQNHVGLLDAAIPQYSYPDMITQTIHIGDCELLERWMDFRMFDNELQWADWENRTLIHGMAAWNNIENSRFAAMPGAATGEYPVGSSECIEGWMGLSPLVLNPHFGSAPGISPAEQAAVEWTHFSDAINIYGRAIDGFAARTWSNVGVQYGLAAVADGSINPEQFLHLNANVGTWKNEPDMVQERCPYIQALCPDPAALAGLSPFPDIWPNLIDPWAMNNMALSADGGLTPAPRAVADPGAVEAAFNRGLVNIGAIEIPIIDWRHYLERELDMHNSHQSFAARQRLLNYDGDASNHVIWFTDSLVGGAEFDQTPLAFAVIDEWMLNIASYPERGVAGNKPSRAVDSCFNDQGALIASGDNVWAGILDNEPDGTCTTQFPIFSTSRIVAGAPITGDVFQCHLKPVADAISKGLYGVWTPTSTEYTKLNTIFPDGVCDYSRGDALRP